MLIYIYIYVRRSFEPAFHRPPEHQIPVAPPTQPYPVCHPSPPTAPGPHPTHAPPLPWIIFCIPPTHFSTGPVGTK